MKLLRLLENMQPFPNTKEEVEALLIKYGIKNHTINEDLTVDVDGNVDLGGIKITGIPVKFGKVSGDFTCYNNHLKSLDGSPKHVGGDFDCSYNMLPFLDGSPKEVGGDFNCYKNQLKSLRGAPREVGRNFNCNHNRLTSLQGSPREVVGHFDCSDNLLATLVGCPREVGEDFYCYNNPQLKSLNGIGHVHGLTVKVIL